MQAKPYYDWIKMPTKKYVQISLPRELTDKLDEIRKKEKMGTTGLTEQVKFLIWDYIQHRESLSKQSEPASPEDPEEEK